ncbi:MAG: MFS transporter [Brevibacterium aurantiacum]
MMGISTVLIGLFPGLATWNDAAPIILILLRVLQGIAVGGEWSGSVLLSMEWGDQKGRGLIGSWPQLGVAIGLMLSIGPMALFNASFGKDAFNASNGYA